MEHATEAKIHSGGFPVGPDIRALNEAFPNLTAGTVLPYEDLEIVIGAGWRTPRFRRVLNAWRDSLEPSGRLTKCDPGKALVILKDDLAIGHIYDEVGVAKRKVRKTARRAQYVRPKGELQIARADHARQITARLAHIMVTYHDRVQLPARTQPLAIREATE